MSTHLEPAPPYPADDYSLQNFHRSNSQERQYGQAPVEQRGYQELEGQYGVPSPHRRHYYSRPPERPPVLLPIHDSSFAQTRTPISQPPQFLEANLSCPPPSSGMSSSSLSPSDQDFLSEALAFTRNMTLVPSRVRNLESPIAIPQTAPGIGKSFLRAWAPTLQCHNITVPDFIAFIDNLNVVSTASPPLQILDLAGGFVGMVPHHWAQLAGFALQGTAKLGTTLVSKGRTEMYMREVNERIFKPRGLKVSLASTEAMRAVLRMPVGRPTLAPLTAQTMTLSMVERALIETEPYNAVLDLNVSPPTEQITTLARLSAKQVIAQETRNQKKVLKDREKVIKKEEERREKDEKKAEEKRRKEEKRHKKRDKTHGNGKERVNSDSESDGVRGILAKKAHHDEKPNKEEKGAGKLLWIMIENL